MSKQVEHSVHPQLVVRGDSAGVFEPLSQGSGFLSVLNDAPFAEQAPARTTEPDVGPAITPFDELNDSTIMLVDDSTSTLMVVQAYLEDAGYRDFVATSDSTRAVSMVRDENPDLLLLDIRMPEVSGFDILKALRQTDETRHLPIIVLTSSDDSETKLTALRLGATDFLSKPVDPSELVLRVRNSLAVKTYQDRLANYDRLTGLPNRQFFMHRLDRSLSRSKRDSQQAAVLVINLDRFKQINDSLGHTAGDDLLRQVATRLEKCFQQPASLGYPIPSAANGILARIGGDEFGVLLATLDHRGESADVAERVIACLAQPFLLHGCELFITPSIGISHSPDDGIERETLLRHANIALSHAKALGRNRYQSYRTDMAQYNRDRLSLESQLHTALRRDELLLYYQPKLSVKNQALIGAEALLRWRHPKLGIVPPLEFVPLAEETGLIRSIGDWVIRESVRTLARWHRIGYRHLHIAVNVSSQQLIDGALLRSVSDVLQETKIAPDRLTLELTEHEIFNNVRENTEILNELRKLGVKISVDDFGTGYSSLSYLEQFAIDELKIDQAFIRKISLDNNDAPIVSAIIAMARSMNFKVVAEGVETEHQLRFLEAKQCDEWQGFLYSKPVPAQMIDELLSHPQMAQRS